jgi:hypothetical protein
MEKVKAIYLTKQRFDKMSYYSTGIIYVLESGDIYEAISTDVMEQTTLSKLTQEDLELLLD